MNRDSPFWLLALAAGALLAFYGLARLADFPQFGGECDPPPRPAAAPDSAEWLGGCEAGHWAELVEIRDTLYRLRHYTGRGGQLLMDADYAVGPEAPARLRHFVTGDNWRQTLRYVGNNCYHARRPDSAGKAQRFLLEPVFPAYGGADWTLLKKKYGLSDTTRLNVPEARAALNRKR